MAAVTAGHELLEAGHGDITITDDADGFYALRRLVEHNRAY